MFDVSSHLASTDEETAFQPLQPIAAPLLRFACVLRFIQNDASSKVL
jgi:hypothetical protein